MREILHYFDFEMTKTAVAISVTNKKYLGQDF